MDDVDSGTFGGELDSTGLPNSYGTLELNMVALQLGKSCAVRKCPERSNRNLLLGRREDSGGVVFARIRQWARQNRYDYEYENFAHITTMYWVSLAGYESGSAEFAMFDGNVKSGLSLRLGKNEVWKMLRSYKAGRQVVCSVAFVTAKPSMNEDTQFKVSVPIVESLGTACFATLQGDHLFFSVDPNCTFDPVVTVGGGFAEFPT